MKQWRNILSIIAACVSMTGSVAAKVVLAKGAQQYAAGHISGKVDAIVNSMAISAEDRTRMLELELRNARQLGARDLTSHIEAHLGFARQRQNQLRSLLVPSQFAKDAFVKYCIGVVDAAAPFSDTSDVPGFATVSEERQRSITARAQRAEENSEVAEFCRQVQRVHENVARLVFADKKVSAVTSEFITAFVGHMSNKYGVKGAGMREEISFRVLDILVDAPPTDPRTIAEVVGPFLATYNTYVTEENKITTEELGVLYFGWPKLITTVESSDKHIMLLLSFAMERLKNAVKAQAELRSRQEQLVAKTKEAAERLKGAGVALDSKRMQEPVYVQNQCAKYTSTVIDAAGGHDKLTEADRTRVGQFTELSRQLNKLSADYEAVVRQQADFEAVRSAHDAYSRLPQAHQEQLGNLFEDISQPGGTVPGGGMVKGGFGGAMTQKMHAENEGNTILSVAIPIVVATGAVAAYHYAVKYAQKKEADGSLEQSKFAPILRFLKNRNTPLQVGKNMINKVKARLGITPKEEPASSPVAEAAASSASQSPAADASVVEEPVEPGAVGDDDELFAAPDETGSAVSTPSSAASSVAASSPPVAARPAVAPPPVPAAAPAPAPNPEAEAPPVSAAVGRSAQQPPAVPARAVEAERARRVPEQVGEVPTEKDGERRVIKQPGRLSSPKPNTKEAAHVYARALQELKAGANLQSTWQSGTKLAGNLRALKVKRDDRKQTHLLKLLNNLRAVDDVGEEYVDALLYTVYGDGWGARKKVVESA